MFVRVIPPPQPYIPTDLQDDALSRQKLVQHPPQVANGVDDVFEPEAMVPAPNQLRHEATTPPRVKYPSGDSAGVVERHRGEPV